MVPCEGATVYYSPTKPTISYESTSNCKPEALTYEHTVMAVLMEPVFSWELLRIECLSLPLCLNSELATMEGA
jgi:hypothetical protein